MCIRDRVSGHSKAKEAPAAAKGAAQEDKMVGGAIRTDFIPVSYTHLRAHETVLDLVCRLLLEKKNN